MSNHMSTEATIKNLEIQVGQLAKQMVEKPTNSFGANTKNNPREEYKAVWTRSLQKIEVDQSEEERAIKTQRTSGKVMQKRGAEN